MPRILTDNSSPRNAQGFAVAGLSNGIPRNVPMFHWIDRIEGSIRRGRPTPNAAEQEPRSSRPRRVGTNRAPDRGTTSLEEQQWEDENQSRAR